MTETLVDPIHYAWTRCNKGVPLPVALRAKNTGVSPLATSLSGAWRIPTAPSISAEEAAVRAAIHSRLLAGRRNPGRVTRLEGLPAL